MNDHPRHATASSIVTPPGDRCAICGKTVDEDTVHLKDDRRPKILCTGCASNYIEALILENADMQDCKKDPCFRDLDPPGCLKHLNAEIEKLKLQRDADVAQAMSYAEYSSREREESD